MNKQSYDLERQPILGELETLVQDWESFKRSYYNQENQLQSQLKQLNEMHSDINKKLSQLDKSEPLCEADEYENQRKFQSVDIVKCQNLISQLQDTMQNMSTVLQVMAIDPEEPQIKLKTSILRRFREIHSEHEKEFQKLINSCQLNMKKYDLFKEALKSQTNGTFKFNGNDVQHNKQLTRSLQSSDMVLDKQYTWFSLISKPQTPEYLGQRSFVEISQLTRGISYHRHKQQLIITLIVVLLVVLLIYQF